MLCVSCGTSLDVEYLEPGDQFACPACGVICIFQPAAAAPPAYSAPAYAPPAAYAPAPPEPPAMEYAPSRMSSPAPRHGRRRSSNAISLIMRWLILPITVGWVWWVKTEFERIRPEIVERLQGEEARAALLAGLRNIITESLPAYLAACGVLIMLWFATKSES